jgi:SagB-type dehydrogenase family enzyme
MSSILEYHERTKHSPASVQASRHFLDWDIQPRPFKLYRGLEPLPLPRRLESSDAGALAALSRPPAARPFVPDRLALARLLYFSAGITRTKTYAGGLEMHFRAAACTGALYHIDLYLVCGDLPDLEAGVYHFGAHDFALRRLRAGDLRSVVVEATAGEPSVAASPALLVCTSTFWRNSWKYQSRTYRHCFWDAGTMLANLLAVAAAQDVAARVVLGFVDATIERLLGLDGDREVALAVVPIGGTGDPVPRSTQPLPPLTLETEPLSEREVDYPLIRAAHTATSLSSPDQVEVWRRASWAPHAAKPSASLVRLSPLADPPAATLERTILRRGSSRFFAREPMAFAALSTILDASMRPLPIDCLERASGSLNDLYLIVNAVDGLEAGTYVFHPAQEALEPLRGGDFRREAQFLDLGQELAGDAGVDLYLLSDLSSVVRTFGDRGYRAAQLEAAILGGRFYLAAYALGLGATGLTFFDDAVTDFFSPRAAGKGVMFLVAAGKREKRLSVMSNP